MRLLPEPPRKALKAFVKQKPLRSEIDHFKTNLIRLLDTIHVTEKQARDESEEHLKNNVRDFLRDTYYKETNAINTKDKKDLVIHLGKASDSEVGVIIEAKRPGNVSEMITAANPNKKALHELIFYYLDERVRAGNNQLKYLIITSVYEWYIIDANFFDKFIYRNQRILKLYQTKISDRKDNPFFYEEIARLVSEIDAEIPCTHFNLKDYEKELRNSAKEDDKSLIALFRILSPQYLLKAKGENDSNSLNAAFYKELLHIIGLEESKDGGKLIIRRKKDNPDAGSLIELTIDALHTEDTFHRIPDIGVYGTNKEEQVFNVALELCITWINRILFLKLLEGQLITYHQGNKAYSFLNTGIIHDFDELFKLFHKVLAVNVADRSPSVREKYAKVPYLNSSLFEISDIEDHTIKINSLANDEKLDFWANTVLKEKKKEKGALPVLDYLMAFLDAYDFASEGAEEVQEDNKTIINASVLGKVFEKINGYKDGSIYTPAFITMYMCRQSIRKAVVSKFNEHLSRENIRFEQFDDLKNYTSRLYKTSEVLDANRVLNDLHICDPAVGSGHFLVSALNELIVIKSELGILADEKGNLLNGYEIEVLNDELIITDNQGNPVEYRLQGDKPLNKEIQRVQRALFHEKQTIIENCLFGVDINPKSVLICRLRLWIELLKNAYYKEPEYTELETLPNIDVNIQCGNSLISRFALDSDLSKALKNIRCSIQEYRNYVSDYKNAKSRDVKRELQKIIKGIKEDFRTEIGKTDPKQLRLNKLRGELYTLENQTEIFERTAKEQKARKDKQRTYEKEISKLEVEIEEIKGNVIYKNAFEWRFEFPEVLNDNGDFEGFDVILGNPPYIQLQKLDEQIKNAFARQQFETFAKTGDIYQLFYEQGVRLLKEQGQLGYITSNKWMRTDYGVGTRNFLSTRCKTEMVIDFGMALVFDNATILTNILFLTKAAPDPTIRICRVSDYSADMNLESYVMYSHIEIDNPGEASWIAYDKDEYGLIRKIIDKGKPIKEWDVQINRGILTGYNEAFIIDTATRDRLVAEDPKSADVIKPILRGEDIKAYVPQWADKWLLFIPWHFPLHEESGIMGSSIEAENLFKKEYPAVYKYLEGHKTKLSARNKAETGIRYEWYALQRWGANYYQDFFKPKIIYPNMTKFMPFVYDKHQFFTNQKCFIITGDSLAYLTAFFNSRMFRFAFKDYFPELLGDTRELSKVFFELVSVIPVTAAINAMFELWIEDIVQKKQKHESTASIEQAIEQKLYDIYALSREDILLIEKSDAAISFDDIRINSRSEAVKS